ncbi:efflux RND transporter periplasmic adaptor subunit [Ravibacter arvi]|uniref:Efflux RND transporter periplasmic adaptor subunit n=1 Tax=Ravibacter arvi TaxID=2051041 RepID=A0ABP8LWQ7_9BACT
MKIEVLLAMIPIGLVACTEKKDTFKQNNQSPPIVDVVVAQTNNLAATIELNGSIVSNEFVQLMPETSGRLIFLNVPEGKVVSKGTVIARINDADLQAQLRKTQVQLDMAELSEERLRKLLAVNGVNQADFDLAQNQVNSLKADLEITKALIDKTVVTAPFTGRVGLRQISEGAFVTSSTVIATMQETNQLKVDFNVPEEYIAYIKVGTMVDVEVDKAEGVTIQARIVATEPQVDVTSRNITVRAVLQKNTVSPGAFAKVYLHQGDVRRVIQIPANSIIPEAKAKKVILVRNGKAEQVEVETGVRQASLVEITRGVSAGDTVVVSGVLFARAGRPVKVRDVKGLDAFAEKTL